MAQGLLYKIIIEKKAGKEAGRIPIKYRDAVDKKIQSLSSNPRPYGAKKLTGKEGYRVRTGNYRILYTIDDKAKVVIVYRIKIKNKTTYN
jgi:mRNA interferase RelE/StbE